LGARYVTAVLSQPSNYFMALLNESCRLRYVPLGFGYVFEEKIAVHVAKISDKLQSCLSSATGSPKAIRVFDYPRKQSCKAARHSLGGIATFPMPLTLTCRRGACITDLNFLRTVPCNPLAFARSVQDFEIAFFLVLTHWCLRGRLREGGSHTNRETQNCQTY
jgi:hypothetical protein